MAQEAPFPSTANGLPVDGDQTNHETDSGPTESPSTPADTLLENLSPTSNTPNGQSPQAGQQSDPTKTARRRNKPSLSCQACTSKKTKVCLSNFCLT